MAFNERLINAEVDWNFIIKSLFDVEVNNPFFHLVSKFKAPFCALKFMQSCFHENWITQFSVFSLWTFSFCGSFCCCGNCTKIAWKFIHKKGWITWMVCILFLFMKFLLFVLFFAEGIEFRMQFQYGFSSRSFVLLQQKQFLEKGLLWEA